MLSRVLSFFVQGESYEDGGHVILLILRLADEGIDSSEKLIHQDLGKESRVIPESLLYSLVAELLGRIVMVVSLADAVAVEKKRIALVHYETTLGSLIISLAKKTPQIAAQDITRCRLPAGLAVIEVHDLKPLLLRSPEHNGKNHAAVEEPEDNGLFHGR